MKQCVIKQYDSHYVANVEMEKYIKSGWVVLNTFSGNKPGSDASYIYVTYWR